LTAPDELDPPLDAAAEDPPAAAPDDLDELPQAVIAVAAPMTERQHAKCLKRPLTGTFLSSLVERGIPSKLRQHDTTNIK
jgi:hypothetical protein